MTTEWPEVTLGELCDLQIGKTPPRARAEYWGPGHPWLSISDMNQGRDLTATKETITERAAIDCNGRLVQPGTVLLSFKLSVGKVGIARRPMYTNEAIAHLPIRDPNRIDADYLYRALRRTDLAGRVDRAAMGVTLNKEKLKTVTIPLPPIEEQRRIAVILDQADELRAKRQASLVLLDSLTESIFLDMFGECDLGHRRWPEIGLIDLLEIPLRNGVSPATGGTYERAVLTLSAVTRARFNLAAVKVAHFANDPTEQKRVSSKDLLICRGNGNLELVGRGRRPPLDMPDVAFPDTVIAARVSGDRMDPSFLEQVWNRPAARRQLESLARTTNGTFKVNQTTIESIRLPNPPIELQQRFARASRDIDLMRERLACNHDSIDALFASLQQRAFSGRL